MRRVAAILLSLIAIGAAPISPATAPDLTGTWSESDWGSVTLRRSAAGDTFTGTYTGTYGKAVGRLTLWYSRDSGRFEGTWSEGQYRFGRITVRMANDRRSMTGTTAPTSASTFPVIRFRRPSPGSGCQNSN
jgi:hypothetical protein